jgi:uncharacterized coiled-coil protein SlyX
MKAAAVEKGDLEAQVRIKEEEVEELKKGLAETEKKAQQFQRDLDGYKQKLNDLAEANEESLEKLKQGEEEHEKLRV